ncbi:MAG TPA: peroxiredoxin [Planctomycetota bacterium]|nr:peroxiredoxin [Planctomycetota bacterium]
MNDPLKELPDNLPVPQDDGACDHLMGMTLPALALPSTAGREVGLVEASQGTTVFFFYPRTGRPGVEIPESWNAIPGARGCTPHSCGYRDRFDDFRQRRIAVYGVSSQEPEYQRELVQRTTLPYEILSDAQFRLTDALRLPTFVFEGVRLITRLAFVARQGKIVKVFYPVFPPDRNAEVVLKWLRQA